MPDVRRRPTTSDTGAAVRPVRREHQQKRVVSPRFRAVRQSWKRASTSRSPIAQSPKRRGAPANPGGSAWPFSNSCFAFDLVITHRTPIQRLWPTRIAGQNAGSGPVLYSGVPVPARNNNSTERDQRFESGFLQRQVRRTPARTGEDPSDLEVVRYWDLAATERGPSVSSPMARARTGIATSTPREAGSFPTNCLVCSTHGLASGCCGTRRCRFGEAAHSA